MMDAVARARRTSITSSRAWLGLLGFCILLGAPSLAQAACSTSRTVSVAGLTTSSGASTLSVAGECVAIRSGLFKSIGTDANNFFPVSGTNVSVPDSATFSTSKATYRVTAGTQDVTTGYFNSYTITLVSLATSETGGSDSFTMYYSSGSDALSFIFGTADTAWTVNISNLVSNVSPPTITSAFLATAITSPQTTTLRLNIQNPNGSTALTGVAVSTALPANLTGSGATTTCTSGTATFSGGVLSLSGATISQNGSCNLDLTVTSTVPSTYSVTTGNVSATGPGPLTGLTATTGTGLTVSAAVTASQSIASKTLTQNKVATSFTPVTGGGGKTPYGYTTAPALPTGLGMTYATGAITGTPTVASATATYTVFVQDANGATATNTFSLTVNPAVVATQAVASTALTQNVAAVSFTPVTGSGGTTPLSYGVSPSLPSGLSIAPSTGAITGTPTAVSANTTYTVTVSDANNANATSTFSLTVNGPVAATQAIASTALTQNTAATSFTPVTGSGGSTPLSYSVSPALPSGLSMASATGAITGTPTATSAATTYTVTVMDANSATATSTFSLTVNGPVVATRAVASNVLTQNFAAVSFTPVTGSGGTASLSYGVSPSLPSGLSISSSTGAITGTPTATSAATAYTVTVTDANNATATNTFSLAVNSAVAATQAIAAKTLTQNIAATSFTPVTGSGGTTPLSYGVSPSLPSGLSISSTTGAVTGTPTVTIAATTYTVTVTDANNAAASSTFSLTVNGPVAATQAIASKALTQNTAALSFTPVTGSGGSTPLSYGVSPALPTGLSMASATGAITGTPTATSAATTYTVTVMDANNATATGTFSLTVNAAVGATLIVASTTLTQNVAATLFTPVYGSGGTAPLSYSVSPALPSGLSMASGSGSITGTPTVASATTSYTVTVMDANNATATRAFSLTVNGPVAATQAVASKVLTQNTAATSFTPVTGSGGTTPLSYSVSPALPSGLSIAPATGAITGTPTAVSATTTYTVTVMDANNATATNTFSLAVSSAVAATQAIASKTLTQNTAAVSFTPVTGAGGTTPLGYSVSPALPTGLSMASATGAITGTPTVASAAASYTVTVMDANSATATASFSLTVSGAVSAAQVVSAVTFTQNLAVAPFTPVTGSGGTGALSYSVSPALPAGLSIAPSTGVITGTPTAASAQASFAVTVTDANNATASAAFRITVSGAISATQAIASKVLTQNIAAVAFTPVTGSGGTTPWSYSISPALPAGLSLASTTGEISGTPSVARAAATYTVTVMDANNATASATFSLTVNGMLVTTQAVASISLAQNAPVTPFAPVTASGGAGPLSYTLSGGALPNGLSFSTASGQISGTPTSLFAATIFTVTVTDQTVPVAQTSSKTFSLSVIVAIAGVTSVSPSTGPATGHTSVTITGANLAGATSVKFGSASAISFAVVSSTQITAVTPAGSLGSVDVTVTTPSGTSPVSPADQFSYAVPADSVRLQNLQKAVAPTVAQGSGQAIVGAIDNAIADGFGGGGGPALRPGSNGVRFNFSAEPDDQPQSAVQSAARDPFGILGGSPDHGARMDAGGRAAGNVSSRTADAFAAFGYADPAKPSPPRAREPKEWLGWAEISGATLNRWTAPAAVTAVAAAPTLYGNQINLTGGLTRMVTPVFLVGALAGWETFDYRSDAIQGRLKGDGWTAGAYTGWKITSSLRFDAAFAYSGVAYDGTAGSASGSFAGNRWLASGGLTGNVTVYGLTIEPSARAYALWEREKAYVDSLGTAQAQRTFSTGRASGGVKVAYPLAWSETITLSPYAGIYADYYFNTDDATSAGASVTPPLFDGWSARAMAGVTAQFADSGQLTLGAERSGIGGSFGLWTYRARAAIPFSAQ